MMEHLALSGILPLLGAGAHAAAEGGRAAASQSGAYALAFYAFAGLTLVSGLLLLMARDVVRAAFLLLGALSGVAGLYALLGATFVAFAQVIVYIGGILILLLFGVMLTNREPVLLHGAPAHRLVLPGIVAGAVSLLGVLYAVTGYDFKAGPLAEGAETYSPKALGYLFMTDFLLPFEVASVLLLVALVGAMVIARRRGLTTEPD